MELRRQMQKRPVIRRHVTELPEIRVLRRLGVRTICNVYAREYITDGRTVSTTGFGDFIRGCFFLMDFCKRHKFQFACHVGNHPIRNLVPYFAAQSPITVLVAKTSNLGCYNGPVARGAIVPNTEDIGHAHDALFASFVGSRAKMTRGIACIHSIHFSPMPTAEHIAQMRRILAPSESLDVQVRTLLAELGLSLKNFTVVHARLGDLFMGMKPENELERKNSETEMLDRAMAHIDARVKDWSNVLLLTDCAPLRARLKSVHVKHPAWGIGHSAIASSEAIRNTMVEFYMMSHASRIEAFSMYDHGSGFSKWCAVTYGIPYQCIRV